MKKIYKILTFCFALTLTFVLAGCGEQEPVEQDLTTTQVVSLINDLIDLEELNFTATANASYSMSTKEGVNPRQTQSDELQNIVLKLDDSNNYINVPNIYEQFLVDGWTYEKSAGSENYKVNYSNNMSSGDVYFNYLPEIESIVKELFGNVATFNTNWLSSAKLSNGAYKLTIDANLKQDLVELQQVLVDYADDTLGELVSQILQIHYGTAFSLDNVVTSIKTEITSTSTLGDVFEFVKDTFGFNLTNTYLSLSTIFANSQELPNLDTNFFSLIQVESNEAFATMIDGFVENYLENDELTLNAFMATESGASFKNIYDTVVAWEINTLQIKLELTTNAEKTQLQTLGITVNGDVTMEENNMTLSANGTIEFSNIGSTVITLPEFTSSNVAETKMNFEFSATDLTADTAKEISNMDLGNVNYSFITEYTGDQLVTLTYNATTQKLVLSAQTVNYLLNSGTILFYDSTNNIDVYIFMAE